MSPLHQRIGDYIQVGDSCRFWPLDPQPEDIYIEHIAHSLANLCRFTGHCSEFYSVASHSIVVSGIVPPRLALSALMHDAAEAYIGDISAPLKKFLKVVVSSSLHDGVIKPIFQIEAEINAAIARRFRLPLLSEEDSKIIKDADMAALAAEARDLMQPVCPYWQQKMASLGVQPWPETTWLQTPLEGREAFLARWNELQAIRVLRGDGKE